MSSGTASVVAYVLAATACLVSRAALADEPASPPRTTLLWLEARPYTCSEYLPALAREVTLACDATGGSCQVAPNETSATRRLVLHCARSGATEANESVWTIEATERDGKRRWSAEVAGPTDDRLRSAAVWVVRAEGNDVTTPVASPAPRAPAQAAEPRPGADKPTEATSLRRHTLALSGRAASGYTKTAEPGTAVGMGVMWGRRLIPDLVIGLSTGLERVVDVEGRSYSGLRRTSVRGGVLLALGAPFDTSWYGIQIEGGPALTWTNGGTAKGYGFFRAGLVAQLFGEQSTRPWLGVSFIQNSDDANEPLHRLVALDLGIAWSP